MITWNQLLFAQNRNFGFDANIFTGLALCYWNIYQIVAIELIMNDIKK